MDRVVRLIYGIGIIGFLVYWAAVALFGTGYEVAGWRHFINEYKGIALDLGKANNPLPSNTGEAQVAPSMLKVGYLISARFADGDNDFYLLMTKRGSSEPARIVHQPMSDYKGFHPFSASESRIWIVPIPETAPGEYYIVGATTSDRNIGADDIRFPATSPSRGVQYTKQCLIRISE